MDKKESLEQFYETLDRTKIDENELLPETQHLYLDFSPSASSEEIRFLEVDETILSELQSGGSELIIRGDPSDFAVACSKDKTFSLKEAQTSNSILVLPSGRFFEALDGEVAGEDRIVFTPIIAIEQKMIEMLEEKRPRLEKLRHLLQENLYAGPDNESRQSDKVRLVVLSVNITFLLLFRMKYRLENLLDRVPASENQIKVALQNMRVFYIEDFCRQVDFDYLVRIYTEFTNFMDQNGLAWNALPKDQILDHLETELKEQLAVIETFFSWFAQENGDGTWKLNESSVCRFCAEMLLKPTKKFNMKDFFDIWPSSVPYGMGEFATPDILNGLAIVRRDTRPEYVQYLPVDSLPDDLEERLAALFREKPRWTLEELKAYIETDGMANVGDSLMKYCRVSNADGKKWYTSKKNV